MDLEGRDLERKSNQGWDLGDLEISPNLHAMKNGMGKEVTLADPRATRGLVALMNQFAINGGAAAHSGGPAAFAAGTAGPPESQLADPVDPGDGFQRAGNRAA